MASKTLFSLLFATALCVLVSSYRIKRVIGGTEVTSRPEVGWMIQMNGEIPLQKFLGITVREHKAGCGGTIISNKWILTAAHCFKLNIAGDNDPDNWHVRSASLHRTRTFGESILHIFGKIANDHDLMQMEYHPESIIIHPQYDANNHWKNDIALIKIKESFNFAATDRIKTTKLASNTTQFNGQTCTAYGWGCQSLRGSGSRHLQKVGLRMVSKRDCSALYFTSMTTKVCAGGQRDGKALCTGDSGGPLMCTSSGQQVQTGVMSYMALENVDRYPGVFTDVAKYRGWIERTTGLRNIFV